MKHELFYMKHETLSSMKHELFFSSSVGKQTSISNYLHHGLSWKLK